MNVTISNRMQHGYIAGGRANAQRPYRELHKDGQRGGSAEGKEDEVGNTGDYVKLIALRSMCGGMRNPHITGRVRELLKSANF
jgi:hypothetical protein